MVVPLSMKWRHILLANWPVDPELLDAHLPDRLTVDAYDGDGWLSITPFVNRDVRPKGVPAPFGLPLPEINLRTYVTCDGEPGIYFFSLDADGIASVLGARLLHRLPYYYARIDFEWIDGRVDFRSRRLHPGDRPARFAASYWPTGEPFDAPDEPRSRFLAERYRLYTEGIDGAIRYTDVEHEPWTLYPAAVDVGENTLFGANAFDHPESEPVYYYSPGVEVSTSRSERWDGEIP